MDRILIRGLKFYGRHGVSEEERNVGGRYQVDAEIFCDLSAAARSDQLSDTVEYGEVCRLLQKLGRETGHQLLESLADAMACAVLEAFPARGLVLRLQKLSPPIDAHLDSVGIEIRRGECT